MKGRVDVKSHLEAKTFKLHLGTMTFRLWAAWLRYPSFKKINYVRIFGCVWNFTSTWWWSFVAGHVSLDSHGLRTPERQEQSVLLGEVWSEAEFAFKREESRTWKREVNSIPPSLWLYIMSPISKQLTYPGKQVHFLHQSPAGAPSARQVRPEALH